MKLGATSPRSLRKAGLCAYFGLSMPESRETSVRTSSPGAALTKRRQRTTDRFPLSYAKKVIRAASLESGRNDTPREAQVKSQMLLSRGGTSVPGPQNK
ncbi:hypothetical protein EVAR_90714_1 [Eumeta japonica]|uniref:Uncharacterized protein n=1 Tax=Eumeta variegata TaxID=151549 RepID=A0A4C1SFH8_EUMVA|nr:hypothetical protein EVAR_90714_1 [Eumeta japonica]